MTAGPPEQATNEKPWYEQYFGDDYFDIHKDDLTRELTHAEVAGIACLLQLKPGARILDLACGHGRHAIQLAKLGFQVTGYDLSEVFLDEAKADASRQDATVRWIRGDMRQLPFEAEFDAVINMFTAFGYFDDARDDVKTLEGVRRALLPGGRFLLQTIHRDALFARFKNREWHKTSRGSHVLRERRFDLATDVMHEELLLIRADGSRTQYRMRLRMRSLHNYLALLKEAALEPEAWYGGIDGVPLEMDSWRLVLVSRKETKEET